MAVERRPVVDDCLAALRCYLLRKVRLVANHSRRPAAFRATERYYLLNKPFALEAQCHSVEVAALLEARQIKDFSSTMILMRS